MMTRTEPLAGVGVTPIPTLPPSRGKGSERGPAAPHPRPRRPKPQQTQRPANKSSAPIRRVQTARRLLAIPSRGRGLLDPARDARRVVVERGRRSRGCGAGRLDRRAGDVNPPIGRSVGGPPPARRFAPGLRVDRVCSLRGWVRSRRIKAWVGQKAEPGLRAPARGITTARGVLLRRNGTFHAQPPDAVRTPRASPAFTRAAIRRGGAAVRRVSASP